MAANSIEMSLDPPTFERWSRALANLLVVRILRVNPVGTFPLSSALPTYVRFTGLRLLLQIGRACSRPEASDDPSRLFGLLKYATSLSSGSGLVVPAGGNFRSLSLASDVRTLDSHRKAVLSDEFGCGMVFVLSGQALGTVFYLDVETALSLNWLRTTATRSRRPDYFAVRLSSPRSWVVLEAKGSQSGDRYCRETQVPDGCDQLAKVELVGGSFGSPLLIVVATALYRQEQRHISRLFVGDPQPNDPMPYEFSGDAVETVVRSHYVRIATLTGDARLATWLVSGQDTGHDNDESLIIQTIGERKFAGSKVGFSTAASSIESFVGLDVSIRKDLLNGNLVDLARRLSQSTVAGDDVQRIAKTHEDEAIETENDGTALLLRRHGRIAEEDWRESDRRP